jgi:hypothetical protein
MLVSPTRIERELVTQEARVIVPPLNYVINDERFVVGTPTEKRSYFVPAGGDHQRCPVADAVRMVQLLVPASPPTRFGLDVLPEELGPNRGDYKLPPMVAGVPIRFALMPGQYITACATESFAVLTVIIEYHDPKA